MATDQTYSKNGEWSGYSIHAGRTGWIVEFWSRVSGGNDGERVRVTYCPDFPAVADLTARWNRTMTIGDAIAALAADGPEEDSRVRLLKAGCAVA